MKINQILFEDYKKVDLDWVKEHCSEALERYEQGDVIYRGDRPSKAHAMLMTPRNKPREAAHARSNIHTNIINNSPEFKGFPKREIIMTTDFQKARNYGQVYVCLPVNGATIGIVPDDDIFTAFRHIQLPLGMFYRILDDEFLPFVERWTRENFWSVRSTNKLFREIKQNASEQEVNDLVDALEEISKTDEDDLLKPYAETLARCVEAGSGKPLFGLFTNDGWKHVSISEFVAPEDSEVWTDSPVVLLRLEGGEDE